MNSFHKRKTNEHRHRLIVSFIVSQIFQMIHYTSHFKREISLPMNSFDQIDKVEKRIFEKKNYLIISNR